MIQVRYSTSPSSVETAPTADLRENFLVDGLFATGEVHAVYTHNDSIVVGGAVPGHDRLDLPAWTEVLGVASHLERRELGIINVGETGPRPRRRREVRARPPRRPLRRPRRRGRLRRRRRRLLLRLRPRGRHPPDDRSIHDEVERSRSAPPGRQRAELYRYAWGPELKTVDPAVRRHRHRRRLGVEHHAAAPARPPHRGLPLRRPGRRRPGLPLPGQARRHPAPGGPQPASRHLAAVVDPRRRRHGSYAFIWAMAGENTTYTDLTPSRWGTCDHAARFDLHGQARRRHRRRTRDRPGVALGLARGRRRPRAGRPARQPGPRPEGGPRPRPRRRGRRPRPRRPRRCRSRRRADLPAQVDILVNNAGIIERHDAVDVTGTPGTGARRQPAGLFFLTPAARPAHGRARPARSSTSPACSPSRAASG